MCSKTAAAVAIVLVVFVVRADALDPQKAITEYIRTTWNQREGLPWGPIYALAQTPDGYLWLPTAAGLLRFDGSRFTRWQASGGESMPDSYPSALHTARDGSLWVGFIDGRISRIHNGHIVNYSTQDGLVSKRVRSILDSPDGTIWVWHDPIGLSAFREGVWQQLRDDNGSEILGRYVFQDSRHRIWICADGVAVWQPDQRRFATVMPTSIGECSLAEDAQGRIVHRSTVGVLRVVEGAPTDRYDNMRVQPITRSTHIDRDGNLWMATLGGLFRIRNVNGSGAEPLEHFGKTDGLSSDVVLSFLEDADGNLWVGTSNGLNCFRENKLDSITTLKRRASVLANAVTATPDGSVWVGTTVGLTRFEADGDQHIERETVLSEEAILSLRYDHVDKALWAGTRQRLTVLAEGSAPRVLRIPELERPLAMARQPTGTLWFADAANGVVSWDPSRRAASVGSGRSSSASAALVDREGGAWIGYDDGHVLRRWGEKSQWYSTTEGLSGAPVRTIYEDRSGKLWVGTDRGLSRLDGDRITTFTRAHGLPADFVAEIIEDDTGVFWLGTSAGIARVDPRELDRSTVDGSHKIELTLFDASDGLRGMPSHSGNPGATRTRDGRLWFLTQNGIAIVDPSLTRKKRPAPPVHIESIGANDRPLDLSTTLELPPRTRNVTIDYTAPDLSAPEKVQFKYRLEGLEDDWREAGPRRQAFYNDLPPGRYRFHVTASNSDGVWNEAGAVAEFSVLPAFYQTRSFQVFVASMVLVTGWVAHRARLWQLARRLRAQFEMRAAERARIAEELHDTLIQDLAALSLQAEIIDDQLPKEPDAAKQTLDTLRARMQSIVSHGRREMTALFEGVTQSDDLADALSRAAQDFRGPNGPAFRLIVQGHPRSLHPLVGDEVYRIAREAIGNAFRHSAAQQVDVEVLFASDELRVRIHDNGRGIADEVVEAGRPGHFGLRGMRERAKHIGGTLKIWSRVDVGTEVDVIVPGRSAFEQRSE